MKPDLRFFMSRQRFEDDTHFIMMTEPKHYVYRVKYNGERILTHEWRWIEIKKLLKCHAWVEFKFVNGML